MSEPTAPKTRGRPVTGTARTSTERGRRLRERIDEVAQAARCPGRALEGYADSLLLLSFQRAYRAKAGPLAETIAHELLTRLGVAATINPLGIEPSIIPVETTEIVLPTMAVQPTTHPAESITVATTKIQPSPIRVVTTKKQRHTDRDARILALAGLSEVKVAAILNAEGIKCSPRTVGNVRKRQVDLKSTRQVSLNRQRSPTAKVDSNLVREPPTTGPQRMPS